jgi:hypothetical protein
MRSRWVRGTTSYIGDLGLDIVDLVLGAANTGGD